jgi:hypothetical protein
MAEVLFSTRSPKTIGTVTIDAFITESHSRNASVTDYPLEDGSTISDHYNIAPDELSISGVIGPVSIYDENDPGNRVLDSYEALRKIVDDKLPITIVSGLRVYENMMITSFECPREAADGQGLVFNMTARQISIVQSQTVVSKSILGGPSTTQKQAQPFISVGKSTSVRKPIPTDLDIPV